MKMQNEECRVKNWRRIGLIGLILGMVATGHAQTNTVIVLRSDGMILPTNVVPALRAALFGTNAQPLLVDSNGVVQWLGTALNTPRLYVNYDGDEMEITPTSISAISFGSRLDFETRSFDTGGGTPFTIEGGPLNVYGGTNTALYKAQTRANLGLGPLATATNLTSTDISDWTNALSNANVSGAAMAGWANETGTLTDFSNFSKVLARSNSTWIGDLSGLNSALGTPASGAAPTNAILQADGNGGSAFVSARTVRRQTTNVLVKSNWATNLIQQSGNLSSSPFPSWTIEAGATYRVEYAIWFASDSTNSGIAHGIVFTNFLTPMPQNIGIGVGMSGSAAGITSATNAPDRFWFEFPSAQGGSSQSNRVVSGSGIFYSGTNTTMTYSWCPANNVTNGLTIQPGSTVILEKISP